MMKLGKRIGDIAKALGMTVLQAERKGSASVRAGRTDFQEMLQRSSIVVLCCPLDDSTRGMIGESELRAMGNDAILVNVSRGGVVDEVPLATALKKGWIKGAATDVFEIEPASASSPLLAEGIPNLTLSPHVAWYAEASIENLQATVKSNVENFVAGKPDNVL
jgi:phosphoglycerate dehydrogenase-like enzyme